VGLTGRVYLRIPGGKAGRGKVTLQLQLQGRTLECKALTDGAELPTGATVRVVEVTGPNLIMVEALEASNNVDRQEA